MIVLGINPGHDGTAVVVVDGRVVAAVAEERLSRKKNHLGFPWRAVPAALDLAGVSPDRIDAVAFAFCEYLNAPPFLTRALLNRAGCSIRLDEEIGLGTILRESRRQWRAGGHLSLPSPQTSPRFRAASEALYRGALAELGITARLVPVDHHLSHAASCFYTAPFDDCLVVTSDGAGDGLSSTWSSTRSGRLERMNACPAAFSPGKFYSAITRFLGFSPHRHEGKVTGLAAFGDPARCLPALRPCLSYDRTAGRFATELDYQPLGHLWRGAPAFLRGRFFRDAYFSRVLDVCRRHLRKERPEDVAAAAQVLLEEVMIEYVRDALAATGHTRIAAAGGVFANVRLNHRLADLPGVQGIYIHPNMGDGGTALGAALQLHYEEPAHPAAPLARFDPYLGPDYAEAEIERCLAESGVPHRRSDQIERDVAELVARGRVVGRFNGRMEYGPRALGNRSILADSRIPGIHTNLNQRLKRSEFMPFAPSVLDSRADECCQGLAVRCEAALYMTICFDVTPAQLDTFGDARHVDGTARAQVVTREMNPSFHEILRCYLELTGVPLLLNTSFNNHEEPIVCSPADAVRLFTSGGIDALAIGPFLVSR